jgi:hypothetical protein
MHVVMHTGKTNIVISHSVEEVVQALATLMSHKAASSRADCIEHIWRCLSVALQRGNARCFLQRELLTTSLIGSRKFHSEHMEDTYHLPRGDCNESELSQQFKSV